MMRLIVLSSVILVLYILNDVITQLVGNAFKLFLSDRKDDVEKTDDMTEFYNTVPNVTVRYLARAAVNYILGAVPKDLSQEFCNISQFVVFLLFCVTVFVLTYLLI